MMKKWIMNNEGLWKGIFGIVIGAIMLAWPGLTTRVIVVFLGISLLALGAVLLAVWFRRRQAGMPVRIPVSAAVCLLTGLAMVLMPQVFAGILMVVFGILLVLAGLDQLSGLVVGRRAGLAIPAFFYVVPVLILLTGFYILFSPAISARAFIMLFGMAAIVFGAAVLYNSSVLGIRRDKNGGR